MNSFLQALYHLPAFRRLVYQANFVTDKSDEENIPLNLRRLFATMQITKRPCSTQALTKSFGWNSLDTSSQNDVQEFCRVLLDNLESKFKGESTNPIRDLFRGRSRSIVRCPDVNFEKFTDEDFYDLSLDVKDCQSLEQSFSQYLKPTPLDGKYSTDDYGPQDAEISTQLIEMPKVLHLHLARFKVDMQTFRLEKITDYFSFPTILDLTDKVSSETDAVYKLFGVLVHSGTCYGGHYFAYLKPTPDSSFYEFNDSLVQEVTQSTAVEGCFGGSFLTHTAYMLIYIKESCIDELYKPVEDSEIPTETLTYIKEQQEAEERKRLEQIRIQNTIHVQYSTEENLKSNALRNKITFSSCSDQIVDIMRDDSFEAIYDKVAEELNDDRPFEIYILKRDQIYGKLEEIDLVSQDTSFFILFNNEEEENDPCDVTILLYFYYEKTSAWPPLHYKYSLKVKIDEPIYDQIRDIVHVDQFQLWYRGRKTNEVIYIGDSDSLSDKDLSDGCMIIVDFDRSVPFEDEITSIPKDNFFRYCRNHEDFELFIQNAAAMKLYSFTTPEGYYANMNLPSTLSLESTGRILEKRFYKRKKHSSTYLFFTSKACSPLVVGKLDRIKSAEFRCIDSMSNEMAMNLVRVLILIKPENWLDSFIDQTQPLKLEKHSVVLNKNDTFCDVYELLRQQGLLNYYPQAVAVNDGRIVEFPAGYQRLADFEAYQLRIDDTYEMPIVDSEFVTVQIALSSPGMIIDKDMVPPFTRKYRLGTTFKEVVDDIEGLFKIDRAKTKFEQYQINENDVLTADCFLKQFKFKQPSDIYPMSATRSGSIKINN